MLDTVLAGLIVASIVGVVTALIRNARSLSRQAAQIESLIRECDAQREDILLLQSNAPRCSSRQS